LQKRKVSQQHKLKLQKKSTPEIRKKKPTVPKYAILIKGSVGRPDWKAETVSAQLTRGIGSPKKKKKRKEGSFAKDFERNSGKKRIRRSGRAPKGGGGDTRE